MPLTGWNGNFQAVGNGVWSGRTWHPFVARALALGYATANTDTGHEGPGMDPGCSHVEYYRNPGSIAGDRRGVPT